MGNSELQSEKRATFGARRLRWALTAIAVALVAMVISIVGDIAATRADSQRSQEASVAASAEIAGTLRLAIFHEQDLVVSAGAFFAGDPTSTQAQFDEWIDSVSAFSRYPELGAIAEVSLVPFDKVLPFAAMQAEQAEASGLAPVPFVIAPAGDRSLYCFGRVSAIRGSRQPLPRGYDYCAGADRTVLLTIRESGHSDVLPFGTGKKATLGIGRPIYAGGSVPATEAAREADFLGWIGEEINPQIPLDAALVGHPGTGVSLSYNDGVRSVTFTAGKTPVASMSTQIHVSGGWTVRTYAVVAPSGVMGTMAARLRLFGGLLIGLLIGILVYVLGTSRSRALQVVEERTAQLKHQALHDPLTGLPNRTLIIDRLAQMMARARRQQGPVAALFLDLDNFKEINDNLGHAAGDRLLMTVGMRLRGALREGDTVGRLGGDEFVALVEGASLEDGAQVVAERLLDSLSVPFEIDGRQPQLVTVSIGIAEGPRATPEDLLHDADVALYEAKAAGKRQAVLFSAS